MTRKVSVYMETYGCSANQSHSELMAGILRDRGCLIVGMPEEADILVLNTCIVKEPTEKRMIHKIRELRRNYPGKGLVIAGCMPAGEYKLLRKIEPDASLIGPKSSARVLECVMKTMEGKRVEYLESCAKPAARKRLNPYVGITEISQGCLGNCSYCIVKKAKGNLVSYAPGDIERDIRASLRSGCREIWLTSQDCGCYGSDIRSNVTELLKRVTAIKGNFRVRLGMSNPNHIKPVLSDLIKIYRDKKIYRFLHIPVQSGSDKVLRDMKRLYVTEDFRQITRDLRLKMPDMTIWTDVIVGFPGETERDFRETLKLIRETEPDFVNISKFGKRPGTEAEKMRQVPRDVVNRRGRKISELVNRVSLGRNGRWTGRKCRVLVTERGRKEGQYIGRNMAYKPVLIESQKDLLGKLVTVRIKEARKTHLVSDPD